MSECRSKGLFRLGKVFVAVFTRSGSGIKPSCASPKSPDAGFRWTDAAFQTIFAVNGCLIAVNMIRNAVMKRSVAVKKGGVAAMQL